MPHSLQIHELCSPWYFTGLNIGVSSCSLLHGIFPTQGLNSGLLHCRWILYQLSHQESPRILKQVTCPFSSRIYWPGNETQVSCTVGGFLINWDTREAHSNTKGKFITNQAYLKKEEKHQIDNLNVHLKQLGKEEQRPKVSRRKEMIKIRAEINEK